MHGKILTLLAALASFLCASMPVLADSLPEKQKTCMQLRDFEGKSYKDIAQVLSITEEQVKVNIYRARQAVKQKFNENAEYGL